jgi:hypothetical protein
MEATRIKPVVGVENSTRLVETIPPGAVVEVSENSPSVRFTISWNESDFSIFRDNLFNACSASNASEIAEHID